MQLRFVNPIIFLDIDGVLNIHQYNHVSKSKKIDRDKVELLNEILEKTSADIVLSSAWRYLIHRGDMKLCGLEWLLRSHGMMAGRLIGVTKTDTTEDRGYDGNLSSWPVVNERGKQITEWIFDTKILFGQELDVPFIAIDDLDLGITDSGIPLLQTDSSIGLTRDDFDKAVVMISEQATP